MRWLRKDTFDLLLIFVIGVETTLLVNFLDDKRQSKREADALEALLVYYVDILNKHGVEPNEYDNIAIETIIETRGALYKKDPERD